MAKDEFPVSNWTSVSSVKLTFMVLTASTTIFKHCLDNQQMLVFFLFLDI